MAEAKDTSVDTSVSDRVGIELEDLRFHYVQAMETIERAGDLLEGIREQAERHIATLTMLHPEARNVGSVPYLEARAILSLATCARKAIYLEYRDLAEQEPLPLLGLENVA